MPRTVSHSGAPCVATCLKTMTSASPTDAIWRRMHTSSRPLEGSKIAAAAAATAADVAETGGAETKAASQDDGVAAEESEVTRPLRILQVTHDLKPGGLQRVVLDLSA